MLVRSEPVLVIVIDLREPFRRIDYEHRPLRGLSTSATSWHEDLPRTNQCDNESAAYSA